MAQATDGVGNESRNWERKRDAAGKARRRTALIGHGDFPDASLVSGCGVANLIAEPHQRR